MTVHQHVYEFGPFRLLPEARQLWRAGQPVTLTAKIFDLLVLLVESRGVLLERAKLIGVLWPNALVEERNLTQSVFVLRKALQADAEAEPGAATGAASAPERYIVTVPGRGYRFIAPVKESGRVAATVAPALTKRASHVFAALAVLPLKYLGSSAHRHQLGVGIADSIIATLSSNRQLIVRPTTAVLKYSSAEQNPLSAGRELQVDAVVDGTIQQVGEKIRVSVQLVRVSDGATLWAGRYDDALTDLFTVQDVIAAQIARELRLELLRGEQLHMAHMRGHYAEELEAWQLYLQSRYFQDKRNEAGLRKSIDYAQQAIALVPQFARGYVSLADSYNLLGEYLYLAPDAAFAPAKAAIERALALDDALAEAYATLGEIHQYYDRDWAAAERAFHTAIALNPNYASAYQWYAWLLITLERFDEAAENLRLAQRIDPGSLALKTMLGLPHYFQRDGAQALRHYRQALEREPDHTLARYFLAEALELQGEYAAALHEFEQIMPQHTQETLAHLCHTLSALGRAEEARAALHQLHALAATSYVSPYTLAMAYVGLNEFDTALDCLAQGFDERAAWMTFLPVDPLFAPLHKHPRFTDILRRLGFSKMTA